MEKNMDISFPNQKKLQLEAAIMIYKQKSGYYSDGTYAAILHKIESNGRFSYTETEYPRHQRFVPNLL